MKLNRHPEAAAQFRECLVKKHLPGFYKARREIFKSTPHRLLAECLAATGRDAEAEVEYKKGVEIEPDSIGLIYEYASFLCQRKRASEAIQILESAINHGIQDERLWMLGCYVVNSIPAMLEAALEWTDRARAFSRGMPLFETCVGKRC